MVLSKMKINKMKLFKDNDHNVTDNEFDNKHDKNGTSNNVIRLYFII